MDGAWDLSYHLNPSLLHHQRVLHREDQDHENHRDHHLKQVQVAELEAANVDALTLREQLAAAIAARVTAEESAVTEQSERERQAALLATAQTALAAEEALSAESQRQVAALNQQVATLRAEEADERNTMLGGQLYGQAGRRANRRHHGNTCHGGLLQQLEAGPPAQQ